MVKPRRTGTESSETRAVLLDVTERLMREEGYAAVSSRRVAKEAGVTGALIHYYFPTLDDLFLATFRRGAERNLERHARALASPQPMHAFWNYNVEPDGAVLLIEFMALANHRKTIRTEIASYAKRFRRLQLAVLSDRIVAVGLDADELSPGVAVFLLDAISRSLVMEDALGMKTAHAEVLATVEHWLTRLEGESDVASIARPRRAGAKREARDPKRAKSR